MALRKRYYRRRFYYRRRKKNGLSKYFKARFEYFIIVGFPNGQPGYPIFKTGPQAFAGTSVANVQTVMREIANYNRLAFYFTLNKLYAIGYEWVPNTGMYTSDETIPNTILLTYQPNATNGLVIEDIMGNPNTMQFTNVHCTKFIKTGFTEYKTGNENMLGALCLSSMATSTDQKFGGVLKLKFYVSFRNNLY